MAFLPVPYRRPRSFGENGAQTGAEVLSYGQTAVSVVSGVAEASLATGAATAIGVSTAAIGVVALAAGYVGLALAAIYIIYSFIMSHQAKVKANRMIRDAKRRLARDIGIELVDWAYGMLIPGWSLSVPTEEAPDVGIGEYYRLGGMFYNWSRNIPGFTASEIAIFLRDRGLDPTRFVGGANVGEGEDLKLMEMYVALPEKIATTKEMLSYLGYEASMVDNLDADFHIRMFDMIKAMGRTKTEEQAVKVKKDIEDWLISRSLNPNIFFNRATNSIPAPTNSSQTIAPVAGLLPGEAEEREAIEQSSKISPILVIGIVAGILFMVSTGKRGAA